MNIFRRGLLACYVVSTACVPAWAEDVSAVVGKGWTLVWSDEFDSPEIDSSKWDWETNCWGGAETTSFSVIRTDRITRLSATEIL